MSLFIAGKGLAIQRQRPLSGKEGLVGKVGHTRSQFVKEGQSYAGSVFVFGALWQAEADEPLEKAEKVTVRKVEGMRLLVGKEGESK
jgi:membrane-bound ClpP family serine protease